MGTVYLRTNAAGTGESSGSQVTHSQTDFNFKYMMRNDQVTSCTGITSTVQYYPIKYNATGAGGIRLYDSDSLLHGYWYGTGSGAHGFLDNDGHWAVYVGTGTTAMQLRCNNNLEFYVYTSYTYAPGSNRAPIFYDVNNTAYYFDGSATGDSLRAAGDIVAYYSDERLKDIHENIPDALTKLKTLTGFYYTPNEIAQKLGYEPKKQVGVSAQRVQEILPEIIESAPADANYMTVKYKRLYVLLIEAIKELNADVDALESKLRGAV